MMLQSFITKHSSVVHDLLACACCVSYSSHNGGERQRAVIHLCFQTIAPTDYIPVSRLSTKYCLHNRGKLNVVFAQVSKITILLLRNYPTGMCLGI